MENVEEFDYRGHKVVIGYDQDPALDPREMYDNVAVLVCEHRRCKLGDKHDVEASANELFNKYVYEEDALAYIKRNNSSFSQEEYDNCQVELDDYLTIADKLELVEETGNVVIRQISAYEHGGITIWLGSIGNHPDAQWDCGCLGFAYVEKHTALDSWGCNENNWKEAANNAMEDEVKIYDAYLQGDVYYYEIDDEESCGGYFGSEGLDICEANAKEIIDCWEDKL